MLGRQTEDKFRSRLMKRPTDESVRGGGNNMLSLRSDTAETGCEADGSTGVCGWQKLLLGSVRLDSSRQGNDNTGESVISQIRQA